MRNRTFAAAIVLAAFVATACQKPDATPRDAPAPPASKTTGNTGQATTAAPVPAELQNEAGIVGAALAAAQAGEAHA